MTLRICFGIQVSQATDPMHGNGVHSLLPACSIHVFPCLNAHLAEGTEETIKGNAAKWIGGKDDVVQRLRAISIKDT